MINDIAEKAAILGKTFKNIPDARAVTNPRWRAHMYMKVDGKMKMGLHNAKECEYMYTLGWTMSPLDFMTDFEVDESSTDVEQAIEGMTFILNTLANIKEITDKDRLVALLKDFFGVEILPSLNLKTIHARVFKEAKKAECYIKPVSKNIKKTEED